MDRVAEITLAFTGDLDVGPAGLERAGQDRRVNPCRDAFGGEHAHGSRRPCRRVEHDGRQRPALGVPRPGRRTPSKVQPGHYLLVGSGAAGAVALVADVADVADGILYLRPLCDSVVANAHLATRFLESLVSRHPSAVADVPTMYHANGKQRGTAGNNGDLKRLHDRGKIGIYPGRLLVLATGS